MVKFICKYCRKENDIDPIKDAILLYVRNNPKATAHEIAKALKDGEICSRLTTLSRIRELENEDKIEDVGRMHIHHYITT